MPDHPPVSEASPARPPARISPRPENLDAITAVTKRRSVRRFLPDLVPEATIEAILKASARAPSGTNIQPWMVHVVTGAARDRLSQAVTRAAEAGVGSLEYDYVPAPLKEPYLSRRRTLGYELYRLYGIDRHDMPARKRVMLRNFEFFGAPMGLFFTMERAMFLGAWLDCGMFMQNVMIVARAFGLETCPQQSWCEFGAVVHAELSIPDDHVLVSGMSVGFEDSSAPENGLVSDREPVSVFTRFHRG